MTVRYSKTLVRQVRDAMVADNLPTSVIDRFMADIGRSTPAVAKAVCLDWLEKLRSNPDPTTPSDTPRSPRFRSHWC